MKTRIPHFIKRNADVRFPHDIIVVDTEANIVVDSKTSTQIQTFRLGYAIHLSWNGVSWDESKYPLWDVINWHMLLDGLVQPKKPILIFAHNASYDYALLSMDTYLSSRKFELDSHVINTAFIVKAHRNDDDGISGITFASTTNFYPKSLAKIGEIFGDKKLAKPDFMNVSDSELMAYCAQDTKALTTFLKYIIAFVRENDLGNFQLTIAGQAFSAFRHRFMNAQILVHTYQDVLEMELKSYRGGRCEVFKMGKADSIYKLDINSMYPFIMRENAFPSKILSNGLICDDKFPLESIDSDLSVMADCNLTLHEPAIAVKRDKLFFPIGKTRQVLASPEIRYLIDNPEIGAIEKVHSHVVYEQQNLFKDYVDFFYNIRTHAENEAQETMAKLFLNSLYGKLGQRSFESLKLITDATQLSEIKFDMGLVGTNVMDYMRDETIDRYKRLGAELYQILESSEILAYDSCPIIPSCVTAYARNYLYDIIRKAGIENVLYCDTDSVFCTEAGYDRLKSLRSPTELGKLKLEEIGTCEIFGAKNYHFNDSIKLKGVKKDAEKLDEMALCWKHDTYRQSQFVTKQMRYREGTPDGTVLVRQIVKHISSDYDKGTVGESGIVHPLVFADW
jgi:hypothetical protein